MKSVCVLTLLICSALCYRSNHYTHPSPNEWICLDLYPEAGSASSTGNQNGALLYPSETEGPLSAGSGSAYAHDREVMCVVCSQPGTAKSFYVQWGRNKCTAGTNVYTGWVGGTHYTQPGGGSGYLCMTDAPEYMYGFTDGDNVSARFPF